MQEHVIVNQPIKHRNICIFDEFDTRCTSGIPIRTVTSKTDHFIQTQRMLNINIVRVVLFFYNVGFPSIEAN